MIRLLLNIVGLYYTCCVFSLITTGVIGEPTQVCDNSTNFNETRNISDSQECDKYYECSTEFNLTTSQCEQGLRFSEEFEKCIEAERVNCSGRIRDSRPLVDPETCKIGNGKFLCTYGKACINSAQLCDGKFDCLDGSDEFEDCGSVCSANVTKCEQTCVSTPPTNGSDAGTCLCRDGFEVSSGNKHNCTDINECSIFATCSHFCTNTVGSYSCHCQEGFQLGPNNKTCDAIDQRWRLIYTTKTDVGYITKRPSGREKISQITHNEGRPVDVTYDARNNITYWTDATSHSEAIYKGNLNGEAIEVFANTGMLLPEGIAFDWITGNIYFADSNSSYIAVCKNDTSVCAILIREAIDKPRDIALHPNLGIMFWTDWGNVPAIMRAGMDGSLSKSIVTTNLKWPNGITVDQGNSRIYWVDAKKDKIESATLDGEDRQVVASQSSTHPFSVDVLGDRLFWSDWISNQIQSMDKFTGRNSKVHLYDAHTTMNGLTVFHIANQPIFRKNPCQSSRCSHICTISPTKEYQCFCPAGMELDADSRTCIEPANTAKLAVAFRGVLKTMRFNTIGKDVFEAIPMPNVKSIEALVYNPVNHTMIFFDSASKKIYEYSFNRKRTSVLIDHHIDTIVGLDIDVVGENLYWVDVGKKTVEVMSFRTRARAVIQVGVEDAYDILVVPQTGSLYLARSGKRGGKIYKMMLNGNSNSLIQRVGDKEPIALAYNAEFGDILWADKVYRVIESMSLDGKANSRVTAKQDGPPADVVKYGSQLFWTDMFSEDLKVKNTGSPMIRSIKLGTFESNTSSSGNNNTNFLAKLAVIDRDLSGLDELRSKHECSTTNPNRTMCSHLCLLSDKTSGVCRCPEGLTLDDDGVTCIRLSTCMQDQFTCNDGHCISKNYVCDGTPDCSNNDDEVNCNLSTCVQGSFQCKNNGVCIPEHWVCDGESDCTDGGDEVNCTMKPCQDDFEFKCESTGRCIPLTWKCDNALDCPGDDSDERGCEFSCPEGQFKCASTPQCITFDWVCDKEKDCEDGSDEHPDCNHKSCTEEEFSCNSGKCIEIKLKCDGWSNCANNEDEDNCTETELNLHGRVRHFHIPPGESPDMEVFDPDVEEVSHGSGSTVAIVLGTIIILVLVAIIIALVLHKRNIQPKVLVRPYINQWNRYVQEPTRRFFSDRGGQEKLDCEQHVYDEVYAGGSASYCNTKDNVYEEVDGAPDLSSSPPDKRGNSRSDSGIIHSERESLYEEAEDCGGHYISYSLKDRLIND